MNAVEKVKAWSRMVKMLRNYFEAIEFTEIFTPQLVEAGAFEACIDSLKVTYSTGQGELNTSPEIEMKKVIAETGLSVFQICKSYRDDPSTEIHFREFTMLEFYKVGADYEDTKRILKDLILALSPKETFTELSLRKAVQSTTGIDIDQAATSEALRREIECRKTIVLGSDDNWDDMFLKLLIEKVEPSLDPTTPTILTDFPASFAALAEVNPAIGKAKRFELYWKGIELANGCSELTDVEELERRRKVECEDRKRRGKKEHPYPKTLFDAVPRLPKCAGVAVGLDRLFMALTRPS